MSGSEVVVATEARLFAGPDGAIRSSTSGRSYGFWRRYLSSFDRVRVIARVQDSFSNDGHLVSGPGVEVVPLQDYYGLAGYVRTRRQNRRSITSILSAPGDRSIIARLPGLVGGELVDAARRLRSPYAVEVVGDPAGVAEAGAFHLGLARVFSRLAAYQMRRQCRHASAASYVTRAVLQAKYPAQRSAITTHYSSVSLPPSAYRPRVPKEAMPFRIVIVANMVHAYKGHAVALSAVSHLRKFGIPVELRLVGDGPLRPELEKEATSLGLSSCVTFTGHRAAVDEIYADLDWAHLFVLPSLTEGLPRALIEAMARSLPCVASDVGGVSELLPPDYRVPPGDPMQLALTIQRVLSEPDLLERMGQENYAVAREYRDELLARRRSKFYKSVSQLKGSHA